MRNALLAAAFFACAFDAMAAEELRTLFHSAAERQQLDRLRRGEAPEGESAVQREPRIVNGVVTRSDGRRTVWIDGQPVSPAEAKRLVESGKAQGDHRPTELKRTR